VLSLYVFVIPLEKSYILFSYDDNIQCADYLNRLELFALLIISIMYIRISRGSFKIKQK
jgi:hypothetical protein